MAFLEKLPQKHRGNHATRCCFLAPFKFSFWREWVCFYCTFITVFLPHFGFVGCLRCRAGEGTACCSVSVGALVSPPQKPPLLFYPFLFLFRRESGVCSAFSPHFYHILALFSAGGRAHSLLFGQCRRTRCRATSAFSPFFFLFEREGMLFCCIFTTFCHC